MNPKEWYGARTIYQHYTKKKIAKNKLYEERIVLIKANSFDDAITKAEKEAEKYSKENSSSKFLGYVNVYKLVDGKLRNYTEVYSLMRDSTLSEEPYIDNFFDTGKEMTK